MTIPEGVEWAADRISGTADPDTLQSYAFGYDLGVRWANEKATWPELKLLAGQSRQAWFKVALQPTHSLIEFLAEEVWDCEAPDRRVKLTREPFIEGIVAGAAFVHDSLLSRLVLH
jgi:hypothetical protein